MNMNHKPVETNLTRRQAEILEFIRKCLMDAGVPPTHHEIAKQFGLKGTYGVRQHLSLMEKKGHLRLLRGRARGISLTSRISSDLSRNICQIPLIGVIAAGKPILAIENVEDYLKVGVDVFHGRNLFALRVRGDSMINVGISQGDIAIINQQPRVNNGEIAAVILDDEATLKRVILGPTCVRLRAENDRYQDIVITSKSNRQFRIAGKYVGLIRQGSLTSYNSGELS